MSGTKRSGDSAMQEELTQLRQRVAELEAQHEEDEKRLRVLFDRMLCGFALHDVEVGPDGKVQDYRFVLTNPALEMMAQPHVGHIKGRTIRELLPESADMLIEALGPVALTGESVRGEYYIREFGIFYEAVAFQTIPGQFAAVLMDVTNRRRTQEELNRYAVELARSNHELDHFASVASHDLNEPLRKIQVFGDRLAVMCEGRVDDQGMDYLRRMQNAASRMRVLIDGLLTFSRVTTQAHPFESVELDRIVREVVSDLEIRIEERGAEVSMAPLPVIEADPVQMRQLFQNLISNSLKFCRRGETPRVWIEARCHEHVDDPRKRWQIDVRDNGIGFTTEDCERIFGIFERLHGRSEYEGAGIGLAVCRKIVDRHSGTILASSPSDGGALFTIVLPATQQPIKGSSLGMDQCLA